MKKNVLRSVLIGALAAPAMLFAAAGTATADHVNVPKPPPPWTEQRDGLTWCYRDCMNWDKTDHYVCTTEGPSWILCDGIMIAVRALPPMNIGDLVPHHVIP